MGLRAAQMFFPEGFAAGVRQGQIIVNDQPVVLVAFLVKDKITATPTRVRLREPADPHSVFFVCRLRLGKEFDANPWPADFRSLSYRAGHGSKPFATFVPGTKAVGLICEEEIELEGATAESTYRRMASDDGLTVVRFRAVFANDGSGPLADVRKAGVVADEAGRNCGDFEIRRKIARIPAINGAVAGQPRPDIGFIWKPGQSPVIQLGF